MARYDCMFVIEDSDGELLETRLVAYDGALGLGVRVTLDGRRYFVHSVEPLATNRALAADAAALGLTGELPEPGEQYLDGERLYDVREVAPSGGADAHRVVLRSRPLLRLVDDADYRDGPYESAVLPSGLVLTLALIGWRELRSAYRDYAKGRAPLPPGLDAAAVKAARAQALRRMYELAFLLMCRWPGVQL